MKKLSPLEKIAFNIACESPIKPSNTYSCRVPWSDIVALRAELTRLGWDWRKYAEIYQDGKKSHKSTNS